MLTAMQKKPEGESRTPTDLWSGMGFSKSMPGEAIRERLARQLQSMQLCDPNMTTTYEVILLFINVLFIVVMYIMYIVCQDGCVRD